MTPKQTERLKKKIKDIRQILAAERKKFGGYDDSRGLRYVPPGFYLQLADYSGGLTYLKWFDKNFPDDCGRPDFLFEWTIILFKTDNLELAEKKAFQTFCSNTYLFDKFFKKKIIPINKWEGSNMAIAAFTEYFSYSSDQPELVDFSQWLSTYLQTTEFVNRSARYIDIYIRLETETDTAIRHDLVREARKLEEGH